MSAKERKRKRPQKSAKRVQKSAKERLHVKIANDQLFETTRCPGNSKKLIYSPLTLQPLREPRKKQGFFPLAEPPKSLEKKGNTLKKQGKSEKEKSKESKKARVGGSGSRECRDSRDFRELPDCGRERKKGESDHFLERF